MPTVYVDVKPEMIRWVLQQVPEEKFGEKWMEKMTHWLNGTKSPTFHQIEDLSRKTSIPLGYFFLQTPPVEQIALLEYRTVNSMQLTNPSRDLMDTIHEMMRVQDWMKEYRQELGFEQLPVVGCMNGVSVTRDIVEKIRKDLDLSLTWYESCNDIRTAFGLIRSRLEECGVVVMMNGIVGKNTHRQLDVDEFRAFAMVDEWAPLIFINAVDSHSAKLFSLLHEVAHIWLGEHDLFNDRSNSTDGVRRTEVICNAVAGELLVPTDVFLCKWEEGCINEDVFTKITEIAGCFRCGEIVVARKALDCKKITQDIYQRIVQTEIERYNLAREKKTHGGNYYHTMGTRLDRCLVRALCESIHMGRTSYTEAYQLTNTSHKTFSDVVRHLGGVEW